MERRESKGDVMEKYCSRCGQKLEEDGFCMNCLNFDRVDHEVQKLKYSNLYEYRRVLLLIGTLVLCFFAVVLIVATRSRKKELREVSSSLHDLEGVDLLEKDVLNFEEYLSPEDFVNNKREQKEETKGNESVRYEANYDEIVKQGEPSNAYSLFPCKKEDLVPVIDEYFVQNEVEVTFETAMENYYEIEDGEKYTYYQTYADWYFEGNTGMYMLVSDSVTNHVLYIGVVRQNLGDAITLLKESLSFVDPNIAREELMELEKTIRANKEKVETICGDYYIFGGKITEGEGSFYRYFIFDKYEK